ncbi:autotransporter outer membrane beta-barrel domain-containing protein [Rahnella woolbedingensis]|nr:autotransporter outer membrane beta-barrel domain-containing protein [Rahnella woolbedingensis]
MIRNKYANRALMLALPTLFSASAFATDYTDSVTASPADNVTLNPGDTVTPDAGKSGLNTKGGTISGNQITINTTGVYGAGVVVTENGSVSLTDSQITTGNNAGVGVYTDGGNANMNGVTIATSGTKAAGVQADNGSHVSLNDVSVSTGGTFSSGIDAENGSSVSLSGNNTISTDALASVGIFADSGSDVTLSGTTNVNTSYSSTYGVYAGGGSTISGSGLNVTTTGNEASGIQVDDSVVDLTGSAVTTRGQQAAGARVIGESSQMTLDSSKIATSGDFSVGVQVDSGAQIALSNTQITTSGDEAKGITLDDTSKTGAQTSVTLSNVAIDTRGNNATALMIFAQTDGLIQADHLSIATSGSSAYGLDIKNGSATFSSSEIFTSGDHASALYVEGGDVALANSTVQASGADSSALALQDTKGSLVSADNSSLSAQQAAAITASGSVADISLTNGSTVASDTGVVLDAHSNDTGTASDVTLSADGNVYLAGDIQADAGSTANVSLSNDSMLSGGATHGGTFTLDDSSRWDVTKDSDVQTLVLNGGVINFEQNANCTTLTTGSIDGSGGTFNMNVMLNEGGSNTQSDQLVVNGDVSGQNTIYVNNTGGTGQQTVGDGIELVDVQGTSGSDSFQLGAPVESGAYEYMLYQGGETPGSNDWYLRSQLVSDDDSTTAYRPAVPGYVMMPSLDLDYGFTTLGRLNERSGDIGAFENSGSRKDSDGVWGRVSGGGSSQNSGRFGADQDSIFAQFGKDWKVTDTADGGSVHAGAMFTVGSMSADFTDSMRNLNSTLSTDTGHSDMQAQGIGGYVTRYFADNAYFDFAGQFTHYRNKYSDTYGVTGNQNGLGGALSGETGKPFTLDNGLVLEPQAQLMYQFLSLDNFNDGISDVSGENQNAVRGRIGLRMYHAAENADKTKGIQPQLTADILHDFIKPHSMRVGDTEFSPETAKTWYEVGAGVTGNITTNSQLYANVKYEHSFNDNDREGVSGQIGFRYSW